MEEALGPALPFDDLLAETGKERGREIALGKGRNDDDDGLAGIFLPLAKLDGRGQRSTRGNANRHPFKPRYEPSMLESLVIADGDHLVIDMGVENGGGKACADALDLVWTGIAAGENRAVGRLDGHDLDVGLEAFFSERLMMALIVAKMFFRRWSSSSAITSCCSASRWISSRAVISLR